MLGLTDHDISEINQQFARYAEIDCAIVFGSRAKGTHKPGSDIDIALVGDQLNASLINQIYDALEETTRLPYFFDVVSLASITNTALLDHIQRVGVTIYRKHL